MCNNIVGHPYEFRCKLSACLSLACLPLAGWKGTFHTLRTPAKKMHTHTHTHIKIEKAQTKSSLPNPHWPAKCRALLIKSNVIQFHYTRPEMCAKRIYISNCSTTISRLYCSSHCLAISLQLYLFALPLSLPVLCHLYLFYFPAGSALQMWPTGKVTTKVN